MLTGIFTINPVVVVQFPVTSSLFLSGVSYSICAFTVFSILTTSALISLYTTFIVLFIVTSFSSVICISSTASSHVIVCASASYVPPSRSSAIFVFVVSNGYGNSSTNFTVAFPS